MLKFLRIQDFALISNLEVEFGSGLSLLTGETGSGKSILVDALGVLVGDRASQEMIRSGCERAVIEGMFSFQSDEVLSEVLRQAGILAEDEILLRREIASSGRNRIFVNDTLTSLSLLRAVGERLIDIHGQQSHHDLLNLQTHIAFLDRFAENGDRVARMRELYSLLAEAFRRLGTGTIDEADRLKRVDLLQYQIDEIRAFNLRPNERKDLEGERSILSNREEIFRKASEVYETLYGQEDSLLGGLRRVSSLMTRLAEIDGRWKTHLDGIAESIYGLEDMAYFARDYAGEMDLTPGRLDEVERRLADLDRLYRKYGHSETDILAYCDRCESERRELVAHEDRRQELQKEFESRLSQYLAQAERLSEIRKLEARRLEIEIMRELRALSMERTQFEVRFAAREKREGDQTIPSFCGPDGIDHVEFFVSPNRGEDLRPLAKIASGGELSRIALALKHLCGTEQESRTLIFDEVDAGIGGRVAEAVGRRLKEIAKDHQVLCVTHLPQIAAFASGHYRVLKQVKGSRTVTSVEMLNEEERIRELARMMGGRTITPTTLRHAHEMLTHSSDPQTVE